MNFAFLYLITMHVLPRIKLKTRNNMSNINKYESLYAEKMYSRNILGWSKYHFKIKFNAIPFDNFCF